MDERDTNTGSGNPITPRRNFQVVLGDGGRPLYAEVKLALTRMLSGGEVRPGEAIPTEKQLCEMYGVSIGTVRKAIDELVIERVLVRQQGRGTFFVRHTPDRMLNFFWRVVGRNGVREIPIVQTLEFSEQTATAEEAQFLEVEKGAPLHSILNLQIIGGEPIILDRLLLPKSVFPDLTEKGLRARDTTIYGYYQEAFAVTIINTFDKLSAERADKVVAKHLALPVGEPILKVARIAYTLSQKPVELRYSQIHTKNFEYHNSINLQSS